MIRPPLDPERIALLVAKVRAGPGGFGAYAAASELARDGAPGIDALRALMRDEDEGMRGLAAHAIADAPGAATVRCLPELLLLLGRWRPHGSAEAGARRNAGQDAARALSGFGEDALPALVEALHDADPWRRAGALDALRMGSTAIPIERAQERLLAMLDDEDRHVVAVLKDLLLFERVNLGERLDAVAASGSPRASAAAREVIEKWSNLPDYPDPWEHDPRASVPAPPEPDEPASRSEERAAEASAPEARPSLEALFEQLGSRESEERADAARQLYARRAEARPPADRIRALLPRVGNEAMVPLLWWLIEAQALEDADSKMLLALLRSSDGALVAAGAAGLAMTSERAAASAEPLVAALTRSLVPRKDELFGTQMRWSELIPAIGRAGAAAIPHLVPLLKSSDAQARALGAWALGAIGPPAREHLGMLAPMLAAADPSSAECWEATHASFLIDGWSPAVERGFRAALGEPQSRCAVTTLRYMASVGPASLELADAAARLAHDRDAPRVACALLALERMGPAAQERLMAAARVASAHPEVGFLAEAVLARHGVTLPEQEIATPAPLDEEAIDEAMRRLVGRRGVLAATAAARLREMGPRLPARRVDELIELARDNRDATVRGWAIGVVASAAPERDDVAVVVRAGVDADHYIVRCAALAALAGWGARAASHVGAIVARLWDDGGYDDDRPELHAVETLRSLGPIAREAAPALARMARQGDWSALQALVAVDPEGAETLAALRARLGSEDLAWAGHAAEALCGTPTAPLVAEDLLDALDRALARKQDMPAPKILLALAAAGETPRALELVARRSAGLRADDLQDTRALAEAMRGLLPAPDFPAAC